MDYGTPDDFTGYLYKGKVYFGPDRPTIMNGRVIWPAPMGDLILKADNSLEGVFRCSMVNSKVDLQIPFERIK